MHRMNQNAISGGAYDKFGVAVGFTVEKTQQGQKIAEAGKEHPETRVVSQALGRLLRRVGDE